MGGYRFPKAPFEKPDIQSFVGALEAKLQEAEAAGEDVDRLRGEQQESIDEYAATLNEEDATEFLLMCAAERLFLQKEAPTAHPARRNNRSANQISAWLKLDFRSLNPIRALRNLDPRSLDPTRALKKLGPRSRNPAVIGISIGVVLLIAVLVRVYVLFFA
jgi:hypothetical protein